MNLKGLFNNFNASKFVVFSCLLLFSILLSLRIDETITCHYCAVFVPLWLWKGLVFAGCAAGIVAWCKQRSRIDSSTKDFRSMVISAALQMFLFIFEILTCVKAEGSRVTWLTAFSPLFFLLVATLIACIWAWRNDRNVEFEIFVLSNVLQIIFLSLRLDNFINWDWQLVLIPLWIELCVLGFVILYFIIWACLIYHSDNVLPEGQKLGLVLALLFTIAYITAIIFIAILVEKVDNNVNIPYANVFIPLHIALFALLLTSCLHRGGNQWWFGMQKSFCNSLLICLPWLQEYGNISFSAEAVDEQEEEERETSPARLEDLKIEIKYNSDVKRKKEETVVPITSIEQPD